MPRRKRNGLLPCLLAIAAATVAAPAAPAHAGRIVEAELHVRDGIVHVDLRAAELLDPRTESTIDSGLPGTCVFGLQLENRDDAVVERYVEQSLRLDLWENVYLLQRDLREDRFATLAAADSAWSRLTDIELVPRSELVSDRRYRLVVQVAVRPLAPEDRERMSRYVQKHSGSGSEEFSLDLGALFASVFGGGGREQIVRFESPWFRPAELEVRP